MSATLKKYKRLAKLAGITLEEISLITGLHVSQVSRTLNGKTARCRHEEAVISAIKKLAKIRVKALNK